MGYLPSERAQMIMPYHRAWDAAQETKKGDGKIGTTGKGIGPCYADKADRKGIRFCDLLDPDFFAAKVRQVLEEKNFFLRHFYEVVPLSPEEIIDQFAAVREYLAPYITNVSVVLRTGIEQKKTILFEGAQGTHLDIEHGTYPFVTSSSVVAGNAANGSGLGPKDINEVLGICKAYTTRVGAGPFPTELLDETGDALQKKGKEFGATTGRKRRCGWLDMVVLRNAVRLNSLTGLAITKLDILDDLEEIKICTAYELPDGTQIENFPVSIKELEQCKPVYETWDGWQESITNARKISDLPEKAQNYLYRIEQLTKVSVDIVSVGPKREETIIKYNPLAI